ncbi:hypothetical protein SHKM778_75540 [Streptomyces sp. KM77-8]|uniref:Uncharacterized protein n=1 Tax=Streptomyces haneummycinicus TaxID=3074435 RepID=A0AAT9HVY8_9ACTN
MPVNNAAVSAADTPSEATVSRRRFTVTSPPSVDPIDVVPVVGAEPGVLSNGVTRQPRRLSVLLSLGEASLP